jgi:CspA family cold shock protein
MYFYKTRKFGFIRPDDGSKDVFVHATAVQRSGLGNIDEGKRLSLRPGPGRRRRAVRIQSEGHLNPDRGRLVRIAAGA